MKEEHKKIVQQYLWGQLVHICGPITYAIKIRHSAIPMQFLYHRFMASRCLRDSALAAD